MNPPTEDPLVHSARREAVLALGLWLAAMVYTVGYCALYGYNREPDSLSFILWFPDWVFWGIIVPWGACVLISLVFAYRIMGDEPLGPESEEGAFEIETARRETIQREVHDA